MITLSGVGAVRFHLQTEEWPKYAREKKLEDPWVRERQQTIFKEVPNKIGTGWSVKIMDNPNAPPLPTSQEKADYRFEEEMFVTRRLAELGYYDALSWDVKNAYPGNKERLEKFVAELIPCEGNGQCNVMCRFYHAGCTKVWDEERRSE